MSWEYLTLNGISEEEVGGTLSDISRDVRDAVE
jgi:hypothetical protein